MSQDIDSRVAAVMQAIAAPARFAGPVEAFTSPERFLQWQANAVLIALTQTEKQDA